MTGPAGEDSAASALELAAAAVRASTAGELERTCRPLLERLYGDRGPAAVDDALAALLAAHPTALLAAHPTARVAAHPVARMVDAAGDAVAGGAARGLVGGAGITGVLERAGTPLTLVGDGGVVLWANTAHTATGRAGRGWTLDRLVPPVYRAEIAAAAAESRASGEAVVVRQVVTGRPDPVGEGVLGEDVVTLGVVALDGLTALLWSATGELGACVDVVRAAFRRPAGFAAVLVPRDGDLDVLWTNRPDPTLAGVSIAASANAATARLRDGEAVRAALRAAVDEQAPSTFLNVDVPLPGGDGSVVISCLDLRITPLGGAVLLEWDDSADPDRAMPVLRQRERFFRTALDALPGPVSIGTPVGDGEDVEDVELVWGNRAHRATSGTLPGASLFGPGSPAREELVEAHRRAHRADGPVSLTDVPLPGEQFVDVDVVRVGRHLLASYRHSTVRVRDRRAVERSERMFRSVFAESPHGKLLLSLEPSALGRVLLVNPAYQRLTGYSEAELVDAGMRLLVPPDELASVKTLLADMAAGRLPHRRGELTMMTAGGDDIEVLVEVTVVHGDDGRPEFAVAHVEDLTERRRAEADLGWLAMHDPRTGLPNRPLFLHHLRSALSRLERRPGTLAVLYVDLDEFGATSEAVGARMGDLMLAEVGRRLTEVVRRSDTPASLGEDDFAVLIPEVTNGDGAAQLARRIVSALGAPLPAGAGAGVPLTVSVGVALAGSPDVDAEDLLRAAEQAMLRHRRSGVVAEGFTVVLTDSSAVTTA